LLDNNPEFVCQQFSDVELKEVLIHEPTIESQERLVNTIDKVGKGEESSQYLFNM
jgi:hypothetical protein